MAFRIKDGLQLGSTTVIDFEGKLSTGLTYPRQISLSGDVVGSTNFDGTANVNIVATIQPNSVALGTDTTGNYISSISAGAGIGLVFTPGEGATATISHFDTSAQASVDNSNGVVIQDVTLDGFGHVTGLASVDLDGRYYTETEADSRFVNVTGDTMTGTLNLMPGSSLMVLSPGSGTYNKHVQYIDANQYTIEAALATDVSTGSKLPILFTWRGGYTAQGGLKLLGGGAAELGGNTIWHAGNDGSGSGLDADLLDGQQGSYYQPASTAITTSNIGSQSVNYATTAGSTDQIDGWVFRNTGSNSAVNADTINSNGISYYTGGVTNFSGNATDGALYSQYYSSSWQHQIAGDYRSGQIALRGKNNGTWQAWRTVLDSSNFTSYAATASHTHSYLPLTGGTLSGELTLSGNNTWFGGNTYLRSNTVFSFLTNSGSAQAGRFNGIQVSDSYSGTVPTNGILFGTDTTLVRSAAGQLDLSGNRIIHAGNSESYTSYRTSGQAGYPHVGYGMFAFYNWGGINGGTNAPSSTSYTVGLSVGSHPSDQAYGFQIARNMWNTGLWTRGYDSSWGSWVRLLDSSNYNSYAPTLTGGGASGTWGINITGYADSAGSASALTSSNTSNRSTTAYGYIDFGPMNNSWAHIYSDKSFYFNQNLYMNGNWLLYENTWQNSKYFGSDGTIYAGASSRSPIFYDYNDTNYYVDPAGNGTRAGYINGNLWINPKSESYGEGIVFYMPTQATWGGLRWYRNGSAGSFAGNWAFGYFGNESNNDIGFHNGTNGWRLDHSFNNTVIGSVRSPIFYDSNDTSYYVDPNSQLAIKVYGEIANSNYGVGNLQPGALNIGRIDTNYDWGATSWASDVKVGLLANCADNWEMAIHDSGERVVSPFAFFGGTSSNYILMGRDLGWGTTYIQAAQSFRAPIFYDSNNTGYYVDPASTSNFNALNVGGSSVVTSARYRWSTGYFNAGTTTDNFISSLSAHGHLQQGFTAHKTPWDYAGNSDISTGIHSIEMAGTAVATWHDGSYYTSLVIRPTTGAGGGTVYIYNNQGSSYSPGWRQVFTSSDDCYNYASIRSPIFYDNNDTSYYCDPNSQSRFNTLRIMGNELYMQGGSPTIHFVDSDERGAALHNNSNLLYILSSNGVGGESWTQNNNYWPFYINLNNNDATFGGSIWAAGNITAYSDVKLKENIVTVDNALSKVLELRGVYYTMKRDETKTRKVGVIAQEIQKVLPEVVINHIEIDPNTGKEGEHTLSVDYGNITGLLIEAIKEQQTIIDQQEQRLQRLEKLLTSE